MEIDSSNSLIYRLRAGVLDEKGDQRAAIRSLARSFELKGQPQLALALNHTYERGGMSAALKLMIGGLVQKRASGAYEPAEHVAELYAHLGRTEDAIRWLEIGYREHDTELNRLLVDPVFDSIRTDPRFADLLQRVGLGRPKTAL